MKKTLCMLLALVLMLALLPAAYAEYEPVKDTPYGLPLLEKPEDFDLEAVINGHTLKRLLDLVDNIQTKQAMKQVLNLLLSRFQEQMLMDFLSLSTVFTDLFVSVLSMLRLRDRHLSFPAM